MTPPPTSQVTWLAMANLLHNPPIQTIPALRPFLNSLMDSVRMLSGTKLERTVYHVLLLPISSLT